MKEVDICMGGRRSPHAKRNTDTNGVWDNTHKDESTTIDSPRAYNHSIIDLKRHHCAQYPSLRRHPQRRANPQTTNIYPTQATGYLHAATKTAKHDNPRPKSRNLSMQASSQFHIAYHGRVHILLISTHFQRQQDMLRNSSTNGRHAFCFEKKTPLLLYPSIMIITKALVFEEI
jgi:hypothetical protein